MNMAPGPNCTIGLTRQDNRQIMMGMAVTITNRATIDYHAVIQQVAIPLLDCLEAIKKMREERAMIVVDFC